MNGEGYRIRIGYAPTRRNVFSREDALLYKQIIGRKIAGEDIDIVNIDEINQEGLLRDVADVAAAERLFKAREVDALFVPHTNFGNEEAISKLAKNIDKPVLLWGPRDEAPLEDGTRLRDSQCGLFATSKVFQRMGVPFSYITNSRVESETFTKGFRRFIKTAAVIKAFRSLRVGQVGTRPADFMSVIINEGELLEKFGIRIIPMGLVELEQKIQNVLLQRKDEIETFMERERKLTGFNTIEDGYIKKILGLKFALKEWAEESNLSTVAIQCWDDMQTAMGIMPCFANSLLTDEGLPVACETDIHGAITTVILQAAVYGRTPVFFADLTIRHPENNNSELLWHCGPFPKSLKAPGSSSELGRHYVLESGCPGVCEWRIKKGDISIARFDGINGEYSLFMGQGKGVDGPSNRGTYVWLEVKKWPEWEHKFIRGPYIHHVAGVHDRASAVLFDACRYIPGLAPDPVEPDEIEIIEDMY